MRCRLSGLPPRSRASLPGRGRRCCHRVPLGNGRSRQLRVGHGKRRRRRRFCGWQPCGCFGAALGNGPGVCEDAPPVASVPALPCPLRRHRPVAVQVHCRVRRRCLLHASQQVDEVLHRGLHRIHQRRQRRSHVAGDGKRPRSGQDAEDVHPNLSLRRAQGRSQELWRPLDVQRGGRAHRRAQCAPRLRLQLPPAQVWRQVPQGHGNFPQGCHGDGRAGCQT
mmetsp:Transcript_14722/g.37442  ORF Transcript_14722/g.37442 Transcript_14722/m.37442 type:complete len:222 (-) Transcript_14722:157-822(-)